MFGIGMPELLLILAVALIVLGPKKLPEIAKSLGKAMGEFKRATNDLKQTIEQETGLNEVQRSLKETQQDIRRSLDQPSAAPETKKTYLEEAEEAGKKNSEPPADSGPSPDPDKPKDSGAI